MSSEEQGAKKHSHKVLKGVLIVIGVLVVLGIIGNLASPSSNNAKTAGSSTSSSSDSSASSASASSSVETKPSTPGLNQPAEDGKFRFVATAFTCGKTYLVNDNEFENATAQGQWCLLSLNYSNIATEAQTFETSSQYLYDASGKQFSADTSGTIAANPSSSQCVSYQQVNPGVSSSCVVAFDVPKGLVPTQAVLHDSSVSDGVKVNLH